MIKLNSRLEYRISNCKRNKTNTRKHFTGTIYGRGKFRDETRYFNAFSCEQNKRADRYLNSDFPNRKHGES